ncbi:MAG: DUF4910 domain-containing protein, partial [Erysipelotrichaceae bacterium]|nr:DUF4910 domain-containing protein [Erysipelotrichaceae bacterium]
TSYYKERYGFCMAYNQLKELKEDTYHCVIKSTLEPGSLTYGEILIKGKSDKEILLSAYTCHPSMANNECSGPAVLAHIARELLKRDNYYSYRIIFIPETIGAITYLSRNLEVMKKNVIAGFNLTCVGDNDNYSYVPSIEGNTLADRVALNVLKQYNYDYKHYTFMDCGSDGRRYNAPNVDLPVIELCRTKYWDFKEYHTSADDMNYISAEGLNGTFTLVMRILDALEANRKYLIKTICEPQLGKRGLYPTISRKDNVNNVNVIRNFVSYTNGKRDMIDISNELHVPVEDLHQIAGKLLAHDLLEVVGE